VRIVHSIQLMVGRDTVTNTSRADVSACISGVGLHVRSHPFTPFYAVVWDECGTAPVCSGRR
jgi:hypothetical protein